MSEKFWYKVARNIVKAGRMPFPVSDTLIELLQTLMTEEQAKFILNFKKPSLNMDQLKEITGLDEDTINEKLDDLMDTGIIVGTESRRSGVKVYRTMPPFPGIFEFSLMKGGTSEKEMKLAKLFDKLFHEMAEGTQKNYDTFVNQIKNYPPIDRVVPVEEHVEAGQEVVFPKEEVSKLIEDYDEIAVTNCYCRHEKDLLDDHCKLDAPKDNCLLFGKTAKHSIEHGFAKPISKENVKKLLSEAEDHGLVHKAFHIYSDPEREIEGLCSCCSCCCGVFQLYWKGVMPLYTLTSYLAKVNEENCVGCGTCVEKCPMEAIELNDGDKAQIDETRCIGCGVCAHHCPEEAIELERSGPRNVFVPPPKLKIN